MSRPIRLSYSDQMLYEGCPHKYKRIKAEGYPPSEDTRAIDEGSYYHAVIEAWLKGAKKPAVTDFMPNIHGDDKWSVTEGARAALNQVKKLFDTYGLTATYIENYTALPNLPRIGEGKYELIMNEWELPVTATDMTVSVQLASRVDCIAEDEIGNVWVFDWKTAKRDYTEWQLMASRQLAIYQMILADKGIKVDYLVYGVILKGSNTFVPHIRQPFTEDELNDFRTIIAETANQIRRQLYPKKGGSNCRWCPFKNDCFDLLDDPTKLWKEVSDPWG
ncbi:MAG: PD-(D/E)XK nuclease family protein [Gammaproteobacteria bacterium]|nr:PD-(D/E)XK nuclease family protein [Gammaproteobacteria bacterium]